MRFRVTVSCAFEADTPEEALELNRDAHYAIEDALVDHFEDDVPHPDPQFERFNLCYGRLEGLDAESQQALANVADEEAE
jgi:hypothetical protein